MSFDTEELKIYFYTNIKAKDAKEILFTRSMLYHPDVNSELQLNEYPYFTFDVLYPKARLRRLTYQERVEFFFDKDRFTELLNAYTSGVLNKENSEAYYKRRDENVEENILLMLELLFPTKFPVINDIRTSYGHVMEKNSWPRMYIDPRIKKHFSYLKRGDQTFTFKKLVWMNDILNHPKYRRMINQYRKFWVWAKEEREGVLNNLKTVATEMSENIIKIFRFFVEAYKKTLPVAIAKNKGQDPTNLFKALLFQLYRIYIMIQRYVENINNPENGDGGLRETFLANLTEIDEVIALQIPIWLDLDQQKPDFYDLNVDGSIDKDISSYDELSKIISTYKTMPLGRDVIKDTPVPEALENINKIQLIIGKLISNPLAGPLQKYKDILDLFRLPYSEIVKKKNQLPPLYNSFAYVILSEYRRPQRESTNNALQNLINGADENSTQNFYRFMEQLYNTYMIDQPTTMDATRRKKFHDLLNVGLSYINTNVTEGQRREIYVMVDFIEGEVNNDNVNSIYCPFFGDYLGNEFEFLIRMQRFGKTGKQDLRRWAVDRNRMIFSLTKLGFDNSGKTMEITGKPANSQPDGKFIFKEQQQGNSSQDTSRAKNLFLQRITADDPEIKKAWEKLNTYSYLQLERLYEQSLFEFLNKQDADSKELYNAIVAWGKNDQTRNNPLLKAMLTLQSKFENNIKLLDMELARFAANYNEMKKIEVNYRADLNRFYLKVISKLIQSEQSKRDVLTSEDINKAYVAAGGYKKLTRKYRKFLNKKTRKQR